MNRLGRSHFYDAGFRLYNKHFRGLRIAPLLEFEVLQAGQTHSQTFE